MLMSALDGWACPWLCSPQGPSQPFANRILLVVDIVRMVVVVCGFAVVATAVVAFRRPVETPQAARFLGLAAFALVAVTTELSHLGDYASYRLPLNMIGCGLCLWGNLHFLAATRTKPGEETARWALWTRR